jgi:hypothetical protein
MVESLKEPERNASSNQETGIGAQAQVKILMKQLQRLRHMSAYFGS